MKINDTYRLEPDPVIQELLNDIAKAADDMQQGHYDNALAKLHGWMRGDAVSTPYFGNRLPPRQAWNELLSTIPPQLLRTHTSAILLYLAEWIAKVRHTPNIDPESIDVINFLARNFGLRIEREFEESPDDRDSG